MLVEFELTTCGCSQGGIGSVRAYIKDIEVKKTIVSSVSDIVEFIRYTHGDRYLVRIRKRLPDGEFFGLLNVLKNDGYTVNITINKWGIKVQ